MSISVLVTADPAASYLRVLDGLPADAKVTISNDRAQISETVRQAEVLLNADFRNPALFLEAFAKGERLEWAHSVSAGVEKVLTPEVVASPVPLTNGRGIFAGALGEFTVGAMFFFTHDVRRLLKSQSERKWERFMHDEIAGHTLGIVGYGSIGRAIAERARPLGVKILALRRRPVDDAFVDEIYPPERLKEMLAVCDYVAVAAPLTKETEGMIGADEFAVMKPSVVIVNVGRGPVIEEKALLAALESKRIRGAALDVFNEEPLQEDSPFYRLENVLVSPHIADHVPGAFERALEFFVQNFRRFRAGEPLENIVDKHAGY